MRHEGACHCGAISIVIAFDPEDACECNCSICRRTGALWTYGAPRNVRINGVGVGYVQGDATLTLWHCATCGITTHWTALDSGYDRIGINLRLFDPALWSGLARRHIDGASW